MEVNNYSPNYFYPPKFEGLEKVVLFPDSEIKREGIPNGSVWIFDGTDHKYQKEILAEDVGCGMAMFSINNVDPKISADKIAEFLKDKSNNNVNNNRILGSGNHFVDICEIKAENIPASQSTVLLIHSDGKSYDGSIPTNIDEALNKTAAAAKFRETLGFQLSKLIGSSCELMSDWPHNTVEISDKIIYRKGSVKVLPEHSYILPAHLGSTILMYTPNPNRLPPYSSMPHATGRRISRSDSKVSIEQVKEIRDYAYIPDSVSDSSLRSEHPSCYNNIDTVSKKLREFFIPIGELKILSYVGKV